MNCVENIFVGYSLTWDGLEGQDMFTFQKERAYGNRDDKI